MLFILYPVFPVPFLVLKKQTTTTFQCHLCHKSDVLYFDILTYLCQHHDVLIVDYLNISFTCWASIFV